MGRAAPPATCAGTGSGGDTHKVGGRGGSQLPIFLALFLTWSQLSHTQSSPPFIIAPKATVLREGQDDPVLWSLWCAVQGLVTLAFPRNKMEVDLPLILLPDLSSLHTVEGPRGLFLPSLKPCCQHWAQQLYCGETGTKLSCVLCHFLRNRLENKKGEKKNN